MHSPLFANSDRLELERLQHALAAAGDVVYDWDLAAGTITWAGPAARLFGPVVLTQLARGADFEALIHPEDRTARQRARSRHITEGVALDCQYRLQLPSGESHWIHERGCTELSADGEPHRLTGVLRILDDGRRDFGVSDVRAGYDELTGHFNRSRLRDSLDHALGYSRRYERPAAFLVVGIDHLTMINDAFGYRDADSVIVGVGQRLDLHLRTSDVVGRLEGDRFGIILSQCAEKDMAAVAEKLLDSVRRMPVDTSSGPLQVTVSAGGIAFPTVPGETAQDIMRRADIALQEAKNVGRNCFVPYRYSEEHQRESRKDMVVAKRVQQALRNDELVFAYQPIVRSDTHDVSYYECLLRMVDEDGRLVNAGAFVPVVERMGLVRSIDHRVLAMAVEELHRDLDVRLAINVSGLTASDRAWLRLLVALLNGKPEVAQRLVIEITETVALRDIDETAHFVSKVRDLGCKVALDDFGAGYTSFRHLQALEVDMVKIDGSFVRNLATDLDNQLFVKTLLSLARGFELETVAECVERIEDVTFLAKEGVDLLQGYYFGRPSVAREEAADSPEIGASAMKAAHSAAVSAA